jgi:hypothetical protein
MSHIKKRRRKIKSKELDDKYIDFGSLAKGFMILGLVLLFIYSVLFIFTVTIPDESIWDDAFLGMANIFIATTVPAIILLFIGGLLYFFHIQFVKLGEFAAEVESGEFERKLSKKSKGNS